MRMMQGSGQWTGELGMMMLLLEMMLTRLTEIAEKNLKEETEDVMRWSGKKDASLLPMMMLVMLSVEEGARILRGGDQSLFAAADDERKWTLERRNEEMPGVRQGQKIIQRRQPSRWVQRENENELVPIHHS